MAQGHRPVPGQHHESNVQGSHVRPHLEPTPHLRRELIRARTRRTSRPAAEPPEQPDHSHSRSAIASWLILLVGLAVAVGGVLQAAIRGDEQVASANEQSLEQQVSDLRVELDKERTEKTELLAKVATATAPLSEVEAPAPQPPEPPPVSIQAPIEEPAAEVQPVEVQPAAIQPVSTTVEAEPQVQVQTTSDDNTLPPPMAPSAELLNQQVAAIEPSNLKASSYGIHLATFGDRTMAERGWLLLQRNHPGALGALKPRIDELKDQAGRTVFLLVAGPFESEAAASSHCQKISAQVVFCKARAFTGSEFAANRQ